MSILLFLVRAVPPRDRKPIYFLMPHLLGFSSCCGAFCYINTSLSGLKSRRDDIIIELDFQDCIPNPEGVTLFIYPNPKRNHIARPGQISTRRLAQIFSVEAKFAPAPPAILKAVTVQPRFIKVLPLVCTHTSMPPGRFFPHSDL